MELDPREESVGVIGETAATSQPWWPEEPRAEGRPNVVLILLDDMGFGSLGCYGSEIATPNMDALAADGVLFTNFHATALCSPTRASLLTGRNNHAVGMAYLSHVDDGFPGYRGRIGHDAATIAETLVDAGYNTMAVGKWHLAPMDQTTIAGPYDQWPLGRGFERFYGFMEGLTDHYYPELYCDNHPVPGPADARGGLSPHDRPGRSGDPDAHRPDVGRAGEAVPAVLRHGRDPHAVPGAERVCRALPRALRRGLGRHPRAAVSDAAGDGRRPAGDRPAAAQCRRGGLGRPHAGSQGLLRPLPGGLRRLPGAHRRGDRHGLLRSLDELGRLDNTIVALLSDNGASQEGGPHGVLDTTHYENGHFPELDEVVARMDEIDGRTAHVNYPLGWAQAGNTPLRRYKQNVHAGGIRTSMIMRLPASVIDRQLAGEKRDHFQHVTDIVPTILDLVEVEAPAVRRGMTQLPFDGQSMRTTLERPELASRERTQYFETVGHRAIWKDG